MSLELRNRLPLDAIQVEGTAKDSPTRELAKGQRGVTDAVDKYLGEKNRLILDKRFSEKGISENRLKLGQATVEAIQNIGERHGRNAESLLARLEADLNLSDDAEPTTADMILKIHHWTTLGAMDKSERFRKVTEAFANGITSKIRAVLDWEESWNEPFDPKLVAEWKREFAQKRNPAAAREFATLQGDIEKLRFHMEQRILDVSRDSGIGDGTLNDRINKANEALRESQTRRTESTADQVSQTNAPSPHEAVPASQKKKKTQHD